MNLPEIPERPVTGVDSRVMDAIALIKRDYGGKLTHDNGQRKTMPTWIYTFEGLGGAQLAIRLNKSKLVMYLRATTLDGRELEPMIDGWGVVQDRYPNTENNPANSLLDERDAYYLSIRRHGNRMLLVELTARGVKPVLDAYFGLDLKHRAEKPVLEAPAQVDAEPVRVASARPPISAADLLDQLDRNSKIGRAGEEIAIAYEIDRLSALKCRNPKDYVRPLFEFDVGRGYDIESTWPGDERCIEVKSTTCLGSEIYLSENERLVLKALAGKAWLYRVLVTPEGGHVVGEPLRDPIASLEEAGMSVAVWRAADPSTSTMDRAK